MDNKKNKRNDLMANSFMLLVVILMFIIFAFIALPEELSEKNVIDSSSIEIQSDWKETSTHPNRLPTYVWFIKISEGRERVENMISFDDFEKKFDDDELVRITYVVENRKVVFYGDEEISPTNIKLWKSVAVPQKKLNGIVLYSLPVVGENEIIYEEISINATCIKAIITLITIFLFVMIPYISFNIRDIYNKDYEKKEEDEEEEDEEKADEETFNESLFLLE